MLRSLVMVLSLQAQPWTPTDVALETTLVATVVVDLGQTRWALRHECHELNPILGAYPSDGKIVAWMASAVVAHALVAHLLPQPYRRIWQTVTLGAELATVGRNVAVHGGVRLQF